MYKAYVKVTDYDDDFCLWCDGSPIREDGQSKTFTGTTKSGALIKLLRSLSVSDYYRYYRPDGPIPEGYRHVEYARTKIAEMTVNSLAGRRLDADLHWRGNWDIQFVVEKCTEKETRPDFKDTLVGTCPHCRISVDMRHKGNDVMECMRCHGIYEISRVFKGIFQLLKTRQEEV